MRKLIYDGVARCGGCGCGCPMAELDNNTDEVTMWDSERPDEKMRVSRESYNTLVAPEYRIDAQGQPLAKVAG